MPFLWDTTLNCVPYFMKGDKSIEKYRIKDE